MQFLYWLFISLIIIGFSFELVLNILNISYRRKSIPDLLKDVYPPDKYELQQKYEAENTKLGFIEKGVEIIIILSVIIFGGFGWLHGWLLRFNFNPLVVTLLFFGIVGIISLAISLPFSIWDTFIIEEKYGFNRTTPKLFTLDILKSIALTVIIGGGILALLTWLFYRTGNWFWILALGAVFVFSLIFNILYSRVIVPLFNKQEPLNEGTLLESIKSFGQQVRFPVSKVFVIDGSKRSTKANAYFSGFGKNRRVVLYDTLIEKMDEGEVLAVIAHEIGHFRKHHIWINIFIGLIQSAIFFYLFSLLANSPDVPSALGFSRGEEPIFHLSLIGFAILFGPLQTIMGLVTNWLSRKMEYQADTFAANYGLGNDLIVSLKKLSSENLSNLTPHPAYVFVNYSHPTLYNRVKNLSAKN
jgi:STE24 endopeptidase